MCAHFDSSRNRWVVRWRVTGRQKTRRFTLEAAARQFEATLAGQLAGNRRAAHAEVADELAQLRARLSAVEADIVERAVGVYPYATRQGVRWRISVPGRDGTVATRRGFADPETAALARARLTASQASPTESFATYWRRWLAQKQPYLTSGAWEDLETHGRKRLLPALGQIAITDLDETVVRAWLDRMVEAVRSGVVAAKTINNARAALSAALADAARRDLIDRNPCEYVAPLPIDRARSRFCG